MEFVELPTEVSRTVLKKAGFRKSEVPSEKSVLASTAADVEGVEDAEGIPHELVPNYGIRNNANGFCLHVAPNLTRLHFFLQKNPPISYPKNGILRTKYHPRCDLYLLSLDLSLQKAMHGYIRLMKLEMRIGQTRRGYPSEEEELGQAKLRDLSSKMSGEGLDP